MDRVRRTPLLAILVAALVTGQIPVEGRPLPPGYPAFTPPWWAMYPQTVLLAALVLGSLWLPLRRRGAGTRGVLVLLPARWRNYLDDGGGVIAPADVVDTTPPRPWSGRLRTRGRRPR